jgi:hypothetical protein
MAAKEKSSQTPVNGGDVTLPRVIHRNTSADDMVRNATNEQPAGGAWWWVSPFPSFLPGKNY